MNTEVPICVRCKHLLRPFRCTAFPDGIPAAILDSEHDHHTPYPGDHGIRYEPQNVVPLRRIGEAST